MGQTGKESLQQRILNRHSDDVTPEDAAIADRYIGPHSLQQCREASTEAATFYKWVRLRNCMVSTFKLKLYFGERKKAIYARCSELLMCSPMDLNTFDYMVYFGKCKKKRA